MMPTAPLAVAGFSAEDLAIESRNALIVTSAADGKRSYTVALLPVPLNASLTADHVKVTGASHEDGMLHIELVRAEHSSLAASKSHAASQRLKRMWLAKAVNQGNRLF